MKESIPLSYIRIWCRKNELTVNLKLKSGDLYQIDEHGYFIVLRDETRAEINPRHVFSVIDHYPSLRIQDLEQRNSSNTIGFIYGHMPKERTQPRRQTFDEVCQDVDNYLAVIKHLEPSQHYIAIRAYESGLLSLPQLNTLMPKIKQNQTFGAALLQHNLCTWEALLAVCLDVDRAREDTSESARAKAIPSFELTGEILLALGKLSRTQLETAMRSKRVGDKPLGTLLIEMGACTKGDIESCLAAQSQMTLSIASQDSVAFLGDLLMKTGRVTADGLAEALRMQHIGRQPLHQVLISMGACTKSHVDAFRSAKGPHIDEKQFGDYLLRMDVVNVRQLEEAVRIQQRGRQMLGEILIGLKLCTKEDITKALQAQQTVRHQPKKTGEQRLKLGDLLIKRQLVPTTQIEEAAKKQTFSRQKVGTTLISLGACSQKDFNDALEVQFSWREKSKRTNDKLGQELVQAGRLTPLDLNKALELHDRAGKPLGEILVQYGVCAPETVIVSMIARDERRRTAFHKFLAQLRQEEDERNNVKQAGIVDKISSWMGKKPEAH